MLKLNAIQSDKVWGYELWIASTHSNGCQKDFLEYCGGDYPLLVKVIQADESLSVQVHPDDKFAVELEGAGNRGKTECWYVLHADEGAKLVYGLNGNYSHGELAEAIKNSTLENNLNFVEVNDGDFVFIPAGTVHAIGGGLRLMEVQQSCDLTYRLYDWGRPRELHIEKGIKVIKNDDLKKIKPFPGAFSCDYFSMNEVTVSGGYSSFNSARNKTPDSVMLFYVIDGDAKIKSGTDMFEAKPEDIFALGAGEKFTVEGKCRLMKIRVGKSV